jgi:hypothetical protein
MSLRYLTPFCALASLLTAGWANAQQPDRPAGPGAGRGRPVQVVRTAWEYRTLTLEQIAALAPQQKEKEQFNGGLNRLGAEGWELTVVTVHAGFGQPVFVFKRSAARRPQTGALAASAEPPQAPAGAPAGGAPEIKVFRLKNAMAPDVERILSKLFQAGGRAGANLRFASDERTNSLLVSGPSSQLDEIEAVLNRLDTPDGAKAAPGGK